jgi:hypothetical protein
MPGPGYTRPVTFVNGSPPYRNDANLNLMQDGGADYAELLFNAQRKATALEPGSSGTTSASQGTSTTLIASTAAAISRSVTNKHATDIIWVSKGGTAAVGSGRPVYPGETVVIREYTGAVTGASTGASTPFAFDQT